MAKRVSGQWLPLWELARLLKVRREKLLELIDEGEISYAYDLRGKGASRATVRIPPSAVIAFLERTTISTVPARRRVLKILSAPFIHRARINDPCTLYGARWSVIESLRALKRLLPTCSVFRHTPLYGVRNRRQIAV